MASTIASQLQAIKSFVQPDSDPPLRRPFTRPSILFDPKEAADIDVETILSVALQGLDVLIGIDERFRDYRNGLFSHKSREMDRELMGIEENKRINATISSYLRLLSVHFQLPSSIKTLEYLIRRYKTHVYNFEELILCSLPYHDTHAFVRIVQLIDVGNSKWKFLHGVKVSGAPPPRKVIVQQCIHDKGVLEVLCNYATPSKKLLPSRPVISFCTAVVIETLGSVTSIDNDVVTRILPFVSSGLQPDAKGGSDHKAGGMMIVGLLASKVALSSKLVKSLFRSIAEIAGDDAKESTDLQWLRLSLMTMINLIQESAYNSDCMYLLVLQSVDTVPQKALEILVEIRDLAGIILELFNEFNIDKFLSVLLDSLVDFSFSDESSQRVLISILEVVPVKDFVHHVVAKVLSYCLRTSLKISNSTSSVSGTLVGTNPVLNLSPLSGFGGLLDEKNVQSNKGDSVYDILCKILDGNWDMSQATLSHSKLWFALHHPKADVRRAVLSGLNTTSILKAKASDPQGFSSVQDAILRQLHDDDLTVVGAAVSLDGLTDILNYSELLEALSNVLKRCIAILNLSSSENTSLASDVALCCLKKADFISHDHADNLNILAGMICPLLLILPKTQRLNLKALELAKNLKWPLFENLPSISSTELMLQPGSISLINLDTITCLAERFLVNPEKYIASITQNCKDFESSKTLFLLVLMQTFLMQKNKSGQFVALLEASYPILKTEWEAFKNLGDASFKEFKIEMLNWDCRKFLDQLSDFNFRALNANVIICTFWRLLEAFKSSVPVEVLWVSDTLSHIQFFGFKRLPLMITRSGLAGLRTYFCFSPSLSLIMFSRSIVFTLLPNARPLLSIFCAGFSRNKVFTLASLFQVLFIIRPSYVADVSIAVQVESLYCFTYLCFQSEVRLQVCSQLLAEFPAILVPLSSCNQDVRTAAMNCLEGLRALWAHIDCSSKKNGHQAIWSHFLDKLLDLLIQQKRLILSDRKFLPSLMASLLGSSCNSLLVPKNIEHRFDQPNREKILAFILGSALKLSDYAKLMIMSLFKGVGNTVIRIKELESFLSELLRRRSEYYCEPDTSSQKLSNIEVEILCLLLENCAMSPSFDGHFFEDHLFRALRLDYMAVEDPAVVRPCITVLQKLNDQIYSGLKIEMQELLFRELVILFRNANGDIQNATREALLRLNITWYIVVQMLDRVFESKGPMITSAYGKKKRKLAESHRSNLPDDGIYKAENAISFLSSLLDILLLKKDIADRDLLLGPLFKLFGKTFSDEWVHNLLIPDENLISVSSDVCQTTGATVSYIQQTLLIILEDISTSLINCLPLKEDVVNEINIKVLVECARSAKDGATRNHVFSLITSITKITPEKVLEHIEEIFTVIGESAVTQIDSHSQHVFEDVISTVVPYWLQRTRNMDTLLQIFVSVLPEVAEHRRLSMVVYLLRTLGESNSLASLLVLLFRSLVSRKGSLFFDNKSGADISISSTKREWEYAFAVQICEQYSCLIWLPSLVMLLRQVGMGSLRQELFLELLFVIQFTQHKLQDPEFTLKLESEEDMENIQVLLEDLMEQVGFLFQLVDARRKQMTVPAVIRKELKDCIRAVLRIITSLMLPSAYFEGIVRLLRHEDKNLGKKALGFLCEMVRENDGVKSRHKGRGLYGQWQDMDETVLESFHKLCLEIVKIVDSADVSDSLKLAAVSALEVLANSFPFDRSIFSECLASVTKNISSDNLAVSSGCLRTTGALVNVLGPMALGELPGIMKNVIMISREISLCSDIKAVKSINDTPVALSTSKESIILSVLVGLEAVVENLGAFLNPYLGDIIKVMVLNHDYASGSDHKIKLKADTVRLALPPLLKIYSNAVLSGDSSVTVYFGMLENLIVAMDRQSVGGYHAKIFDLCLLALDLRRQRPVSLQYIDVVEKSVISTVIALTMKLTETMFKPLLIRSIEWAESDIEDDVQAGSTNIDRAISFYGLVNKLAENHRSLFVPYFKYLLEGCVRLLTVAGDANTSGLTRKKKKAKILVGKNTEEETSVSLGNWQLRSLVFSSLHKCFLYDTGSLKFLDSSNFQVLLKPVVSQLTIEPPISLEEHPNMPSVKEVDDLLVVCIGQMAVTAGTDVLWKPLNHEVLMQTRSEKVRARILGLRIVKYMVEHLREEYLVLLAETIPFLGELLEDVELSVKSLAQEILKEMESMSGESLRQYL
ncbi:U3 small nucleolar RNA-associated protein [Parasponia andersonii]|uniref:U3 small nucleolar RNA-associated protein n=1 Tax=Parasponia andersonii TaxID=3476 RepID=A0A2P5BQQ9_PARAD|nr:U3 small nucleolar RNA-associated protein [Parasponia andersonii]